MVLRFEIERLWKDRNKAKANTRSKVEKPQIPFSIVEKKVSLPQGHKKRQICSSITVNLFHQLHPAKVGQHGTGVSPATSSIDSKKPKLSNDSNRSLEVELGWVTFAIQTHLLSMTHCDNKVGQAYVSSGTYSVIIPGRSRHDQGLWPGQGFLREEVRGSNYTLISPLYVLLWFKFSSSVPVVTQQKAQIIHLFSPKNLPWIWCFYPMFGILVFTKFYKTTYFDLKLPCTAARVLTLARDQI